MSLTRAYVEAILIKRCGHLLTVAGLDGTTVAGTNADLGDPIAFALRQLGVAVAVPAVPTTAEVATVADDGSGRVPRPGRDPHPPDRPPAHPRPGQHRGRLPRRRILPARQRPPAPHRPRRAPRPPPLRLDRRHARSRLRLPRLCESRRRRVKRVPSEASPGTLVEWTDRSSVRRSVPQRSGEDD